MVGWRSNMPCSRNQMDMQSLLNTLFMQAKVDNVDVNMVLVDGGAVVK